MRALVVSSVAPKTSETFIADHIRELADGRFLPIFPLRPGMRRLLRLGPKAIGPGQLADVLERARIDVVLAEYGPTAVAVREGCRLAGVPFLAHFHGFDASKRSVLEAHSLSYPLMFDSAASVIAVSDFMRQQLVRLGAPATKIEVVPCGVDTELFSGAQPAYSRPRLLMVGRLVEKKQPVLVLEAFAIALRDCPGAILTIIGDGPLRSQVTRAVGKLGVRDSVRLLGAAGRQRVIKEMRRSRAVVHHAQTAATGDMEGTPVSLMEAAACGLPVISTQHAGIPEIVLHRRTGLLGPEGDPLSTADNMVRLLTDPELAARLGSAGATHARAHFDQRQMHERLRALLESAARAARR